MENKLLLNYLNNKQWYNVEINDIYTLIIKITILLFMIESLINILIQNNNVKIKISANNNINKDTEQNINHNKPINNTNK